MVKYSYFKVAETIRPIPISMLGDYKKTVH